MANEEKQQVSELLMEDSPPVQIRCTEEEPSAVAESTSVAAETCASFATALPVSEQSSTVSNQRTSESRKLAEQSVAAKVLDAIILTLLMAPFAGPICYLSQFPPSGSSQEPEPFLKVLLYVAVASWALFVPFIYLFCSPKGTLGSRLKDPEKNAGPRRPYGFNRKAFFAAISMVILASVLSVQEAVRLVTATIAIEQGLQFQDAHKQQQADECFTQARRCGELLKFSRLLIPLEAGSPAATLRRCNWLLALSPGQSEGLYVRAQQYTKLDRFREAEADISALLETEWQPPEHFWQNGRSNTGYPPQDLLQIRAANRLRGDNPEGALDDANRALRMNPFDAHGYTLRSEIYRRLNQTSKALFDSETAKRMQQNNKYKSTIKELPLAQDKVQAAPPELMKKLEAAAKNGAPLMQCNLALAHFGRYDPNNYTRDQKYTLEHLDLVIQLSLKAPIPVLPIWELYLLRSEYQTAPDDRLRDLENAVQFVDQCAPATNGGTFTMSQHEFETHKASLFKLCFDAYQAAEGLGDEPPNKDSKFLRMVQYMRQAVDLTSDTSILEAAAGLGAQHLDVASDLALAALTKYYKINEDLDVLLRRARVYDELRRYPEALADVETVLERQTAHADAEALKKEILAKVALLQKGKSKR
jgi:tetratricopeptide (TPR) repeat protein